MNAERDIFSKRDPQADAEADLRAEADRKTGRVVDHAKLAAWLATWGTDKESPAPPEWLE